MNHRLLLHDGKGIQCKLKFLNINYKDGTEIA